MDVINGWSLIVAEAEIKSGQGLSLTLLWVIACFLFVRWIPPSVSKEVAWNMFQKDNKFFFDPGLTSEDIAFVVLCVCEASKMSRLFFNHSRNEYILAHSVKQITTNLIT